MLFEGIEVAIGVKRGVPGEQAEGGDEAIDHVRQRETLIAELAFEPLDFRR